MFRKPAAENGKMNWDDLRYFLAVARHGGLTGAGKELKASASTVARRIEALEASLRTRLFERRPDGYGLTEHGRGVLDKAVAIEARMSELEDGFGDQDGRVAGIVRIVTVETLAHHLIIPQLSRLQQAQPALSLSVAINASFARLAQREADIGLRLCRPEHGSFTVRRIGTLAFGLYGAPDYLKDHPIATASLPISGQRLVTWGDPLSYMALPVALQAWTQDGSPVLVVDSMQAQLLAIRSGSGLGVLPCILADAETGLVRVMPELCRREEPIWLVVHEDIARTKRVQLVCAFLERLVREHQAALGGIAA